MQRKIIFLAAFFSWSFCAEAGYQPVQIASGFNEDVVANGTGAPSASTTVALDKELPGSGFVLPAFDYLFDGTCTAAPAPLPSGGAVTNAIAGGPSYQLADYNTRNCLHLVPATPTGTLTFQTPVAAGEVYLLANSGGGAATIDITVLFSDGSNHQFSALPLSDWFRGTPYVVQYNRVDVNVANCTVGTPAEGPRLYQVMVAIPPAHLGKLVSGVTVTRAAGSVGYPNVMAVSVNTICDIPAAQPSGLNLTAVSSGQIDGTFTAASPAADQYLVVRYPAGATPVAPSNGVVYTSGNTLGTGVVLYAGAGTAFSATLLTAATTYDFYIYAYNNTGCVGPIYNTTAPLTGSRTTPACTGPSGIIAVGPSGAYTTLTAALSALNTGIGGSVILELQPDYTSTAETFPVVISYNACISPVHTLTIRPAAGAAGLSVTGSNAGPTIDINGARYVTIDGTPGGSSGTPPVTVTPAGALHPVNLNIRNTSNSGVAVRIDNGAAHNIIRYCDLQGQNNTGADGPGGMAGVVFIGNTTLGVGNDHNTIERCNIHSTDITALPSIGVYALGPNNNGLSAAFHDSGVISGCHIYDYFLPGGNSAGVELNQGVHAWKVTDNSFFQTSARTFTAGGFNRPVWIVPNRNTGSAGNGFVVSGNYIGGQEPQCGGGAYTFSGQANHFNAIRIDVKDGPTPAPSVVRDNVITNFAQTTTTAAANSPFTGIAVVASGSVDILNNIIGGATGTDLITVSAGNGGQINGIMISNGAGGTPVFNIRKNVIGGITTTANGNSFNGILVNNTGDHLVDSNLIGSETTPNSIRTMNTGTGVQFIRAIDVPAGSPVISVTNNTIAHLTNNTLSTTDGAQVAGIRIASASASVPLISGNVVRNLTSDSRAIRGQTNTGLLGIAMTATTALPCTISDNIVHSMVSNSPNQVFLEGIFLQGHDGNNVVNTISGNIVHSLSVSNPANSAANMRGVECSRGAAVIINNMVRLGIHPDGSPLTNAMQVVGIMKGSTKDCRIYFNSVYIGGTGVGTNTDRHSAAFRKENANGADTVVNNILVNMRSNAAAGSNHFSVWVNSATNVVYDHNVYHYGTTGGGNFAAANSNGTSNITAVYAPGWIAGDNNSLAADPVFTAPEAPAASVDLHINPAASSPVEGAGLPVSSVTEDYDGQLRASLTPTDIGADAGNFFPLSVQVIANNSPVCTNDTIRLTAAATASVPGLVFHWTGPNSFTDTGATITIPNASASDAGVYQVYATVGGIISDTADATVTITGSVTPTVSIASVPGATICAGTPVTFTATAAGGGASPLYQWRKNGVAVGGSGNTYTDNALANSDVIVCRLTSSATCVTPDTALSNAFTMTVNPSPVPAVTIVSGSGTTICTGTTVTFTATPVNEGTTPVYQWRKNGVPVGGNSITYTDNALVNGDAITCRLTSNAPCARPDSAVSNMLTMSVSAVQAPSVTIAAGGGTSVCAGMPVTFTATPVNPGTTPVYQWRKNGAPAGGNNITYTDNTLTNGDVITCRLTSSAGCAIPDSAVSNSLAMTVNPALTPSVTVATPSGSTICENTYVTFTATPVNGGNAPVYEWRRNGLSVGTNSATYTDNVFSSGDIISCLMTSNAVCAAPDTALSNEVALQITPAPSAAITVSGAPDICMGDSILLTAAAGDTYEWRQSGVLIPGAASRSYKTGETGNYTVTVTVAGCAASTDAPVRITAHPHPSPAVIVKRDTLLTDTFYARYQWYLDGRPVPGAERYMHLATAPGLYFVFVEDSFGCGGNSAFYTIDGVDIPSLAANDGTVHIYPNPARDMVFVRSFYPVRISLQTMDGRIVLNELDTESISIGHLPDGVYMIRVRDKNGRIVRTQKLVKTGH